MNKIVSDIDKKTKLCVSLHSILFSVFVGEQYTNESNDVYLTKSKSFTETLQLTGENNFFVVEQMLRKKLDVATPK